jgi:hypothetical protein
VQVDDEAALGSSAAVLLAHHHAAAGGQHRVIELRHLVDDLLLAVAEALLALDVEDPGDIGAGARSISVVAVGEAELQGAREELADGGLAGPHGADEKDAAVLRHSARAGLSRAACRRGSAA